MPFAESVGTLVELKQQGKIRHIGLSNVSEPSSGTLSGSPRWCRCRTAITPGDRSSDSMVDLCDQESLVFLPWVPIQDTDRLPPVLSAASRHHVFSARQVALAWLLTRSAADPADPRLRVGRARDRERGGRAVQLTNDEANAILDVA